MSKGVYSGNPCPIISRYMDGLYKVSANSAITKYIWKRGLLGKKVKNTLEETS